MNPSDAREASASNEQINPAQQEEHINIFTGLLIIAYVLENVFGVEVFTLPQHSMEFSALKTYIEGHEHCTFIQNMETLLEAGKAKFTALYDMVAATLIMNHVEPDNSELMNFITNEGDSGDTVRQNLSGILDLLKKNAPEATEAEGVCSIM